MISLRKNLFVCCVVILMSQTCRTSASWFDECKDTVHVNGVNIFNCSGKNLFNMPETLPEDAEVLDYSRNFLDELPLIPESKECHKEANCHVVNTTNHCRIDISFSRNRISRFHEKAFHDLRCLQYLDLSFNEIKSNIFETSTFQGGFNRLQVLNLSNNPLGSLPDNSIVSPFMADLRSLDLSHCELEDMGRDSVDDFEELRILNLSFNKLTTIHADTFKGLRKLERLELQQNRLTYFPEHVFGDLVSLKVLLLTDNSITEFHTNAFYRDSNLLVLALQNNQLTSIPYSAVDKLPKLNTLDLSLNPINNVKPGALLSSVKNLVLDNIQSLSKLDKQALASFPDLVSLSCSGNENLRTIHADVLESNSASLRHVRLENNQLRSLSSKTLPWKQLKTLRLGGNPWLCDTQMEWMIEADALEGPAVCSEPPKLKGRDIRSLSTHELVRYYPTAPAIAVISFLIVLPVVCACVVLTWKRRKHCPCLRAKLQGRYVSVYTRDVDEDGEDSVAIELKTNVNRLKAVSNGGADDTKPFIKVEGKEGDDKDDDEEEI